MRRTLIAAASFAFLLGSATATASAAEDPDSTAGSDHVVVASGLDNPRQLSWDGRTLLIAEGGRGGEDCAPAETPAEEPSTPETPTGETPAAPDDDGTPDQGTGDVPPTPDTPLPDDDGTPDQGTGDVPPTPGADTPLPDDGTSDDGVCGGFTGGISAVERPGRAEDTEPERIVDQLYSVETAEGTVGSDGVAATGIRDVLVIAQGEGTPELLAGAGLETDDADAETQEHLLLSIDGAAVPWVDLGAAEEELNPDGKAALDSNPNAVLAVDPGRGGAEYVLVADAGANAVWKVTPDFSDRDEDGLPGYEISVFAAYQADDDPTTSDEFAPSALAQDRDGNVYVGGVGAAVAGNAAVGRYDRNGEETGRWDGFTGINGLAVDRDGEHVYVAQVFGSDGPPAGTGTVVRFDTAAETYATVDVPFPSGLALGRNGAVYVSAYSTFAADGDDPLTTDVVEGGQVWRFTFPRDAEETALPVTTPPSTDDPATPDPSTPDPTTPAPTDDDGTPDQGSGDVPGTTPDPATPDPATPAPTDDDGTPDQGSGDA
ncbi:ScyD/ScyE family protein [Geodermatophilus ruber]|uniref:Uncharacterized protein n=1 Tax=Geodermatophilus ruber TaxID=504800 RepID=A0A1I4EGU2_9ACTN|nr:ScyD/ScyE family protein [Geodermatophilus ruber]SFL04449.1 hypothetical protein SAMN04488085_1062 [Geodermatophilus ruber]